MTTTERPVFRQSSDRMFIIQQSKVSYIAMDEEESDFSYEQRKWLDFKEAITKIYSQKINSIDSCRVIDLILILNEKEKKIAVWLRREKQLLAEEDIHVVEILGI